MDLDLTQISEQMKSQAAATLQELIGIYSEGGDPVTTGSAESFPYGQGVQDSFAYMLAEAERLGIAALDAPESAEGATPGSAGPEGLRIAAGDLECLRPLLCDTRGRLEFEIARKLSKSQAIGSGLELRHLSGGIAADRVPDKARAVLLYRDAAASNKTKGRASGNTAGARSGGASSRRTAADVYEQIRTLLAQYREDTGYHLTSRRVGKSLEILAGGKVFHAANPEKGVNAIAVLLGFLDMLDLENDDLHDFVRFYRDRIAFDPYGEKLGIACGAEPGSEAACGETPAESPGILTVNNGIISYDRRVIRIRMDVRYPSIVTEEEIYGKLTPLLDENGLGIVKLSRMEPVAEGAGGPEIEGAGDSEIEEAANPEMEGAGAPERFYQLIGLLKTDIVGE